MNSSRIMDYKRASKYLLLVGLIFSQITSWAKKDIASTLQTTLIPNSTVLVVEDVKYSDMLNNSSSVWSLVYKNMNSTAIIDFGVDMNNHTVQDETYQSSINLEVKYWSYTGNAPPMAFVQTTVTKTLTVTHDAESRAIQVASLKYDNVYRLEVKVLTPNPAPSGTLRNLFLKTSISVDRRYDMDRLHFTNHGINNINGSVDPFIHPPASDNTIKLEWEDFSNAEGYDLEWMYIDDYKKDGSALTSSEIKVEIEDFKRNATRVSLSRDYSTNKEQYILPLLYERGYLFFRLRGKGYVSEDNYQSIYEGEWTTTTTSIASVADIQNSLNEFLYYHASSYHDHLNWLSNTVYIEDGKSSVSVSFADGINRVRQSVTKIGSENEAIVSEVVPDFQGREAIQFLPAPTNDPEIKFYSNFNKNLLGEAYQSKNFDFTDDCVDNTEASFSENGPSASNYYSPNNPNSLSSDQYVPDAKGYPFTQVKYLSDNSGRIKSTTQAGINFKHGSGHETSFLYSMPKQLELDELFGSDAGYFIKYKKNYTISPNGQMSASYIDQNGQIVATALVNGNDVLEDLPSLSPSATKKDDLLGKRLPSDKVGALESIDLLTGTRVMRRTIMVPQEEIIYFDYYYDKTNYDFSCTNESGTTMPPPCYDCVVDIEIHLTNDCGEEFLGGLSANDNEPNKIRFGEGITTASLCGSDVDLQKIAWESNIDGSPTALKKGVYKLSKEVTINFEKLEEFTSHYIQNNECVSLYSQFYAEEEAKVDLDACNVTCQSCTTALGANWASSPYNTVNACEYCITESEYNLLVEECLESCNNKSSLCENGLDNMIADMSPGGQYGEVEEGGVSNGQIAPVNTNINPHKFPLSIYNERNFLQRRIGYPNQSSYPKTSWRYPHQFPVQFDATGVLLVGDYLDPDGSVSLIKLFPDPIHQGQLIPAVKNGASIQTDVDGQKYIKPVDLADVRDFIRLFRESWGKQLVAYHPEYGNYQVCLNLAASNDFDEELLDSDFDDVLANYGNFANSHTDSRFFILDDPFFSSTNPYYSTQMTDAMEERLVNYAGGSGLSMNLWELVWRMEYCKNPNCSSCSPLLVAPHYKPQLDQKTWENFKLIYLSIKSDIRERLMIDKTINAPANNTIVPSYSGCIGVERFDPNMNSFRASPTSGLITNLPINIPGTSLSWGTYFSILLTVNSQYYNPGQPCNAFAYNKFKNKVRRFGSPKYLSGIDALLAEVCITANQYSQASCDQQNEQVINEMKKDHQRKRFLQCGQCPLAFDFEIFLKEIAANEEFSLASDIIEDLPCNISSLTEELSVELFGTPLDEMAQWQNVGNSNEPQIQLGNCTFDFQDIADASGGEIADYHEVVDVCCLKALEDGVYEITVYTSNGTSVAVRIEGCLNLSECTFEDNCKISSAGYDILNFLNASLSIKSYTYAGFPQSDFETDYMQSYSGNSVYLSPPSNFILEGVSTSSLGNNGHDQSVQYKGSYGNMLEHLKAYWQSLSPSALIFNAIGYHVEHNSPNTIEFTFEYESQTSWTGSFTIGLIVNDPNIPISSTKQFTSISFDEVSGSIVLTAIDEFYTPFTVNLEIGYYPMLHCTSLEEQEIALSTSDEMLYQCEATPIGKALEAYLSEVSNLGLSLLPDGEMTKQLFQVSSTNLNLGSFYGGTIPFELFNGDQCPITISLINNEYSLKDLNDISRIQNFSALTSQGALTAFGTASMLAEVIFNDGTSGNIRIDFECGTLYQCYNIPANACEVEGLADTIQYELERFTGTAVGSLDLLRSDGSTCSIDVTLGAEIEEILYVGVYDRPDPNGYLFQGYIIARLNNSTDINQSIKRIDFSSSCYLGKCNACVGNNLISNGFFNRMEDAYSTSDVPTLQNRINGTHNPGAPGYTPYTHSRQEDFGTKQRIKSYGNSLVIRKINHPTTNITFWQQTIALKANTVYEFNMKAVEISGANLSLEYTPNSSTILGNSHTFSASQITEWKNHSHTFTTPNFSGNYTINLNATVANNSLFAVDNLLLKERCIREPSILCGRITLPEPKEYSYQDSCEKELRATIALNATRRYEEYIREERIAFKNAYIAKCLSNNEAFTMDYVDLEHHFTLYYYDESGNLVRTVPPKGVKKIDSPSELATIPLDRASGRKTVFTEHKMATTYAYNSLNQLTHQQVPDNEDINEYYSSNSSASLASNFQGNSLSFSNDYSGVLAGELNGDGLLYYTDDGGQTWKKSKSSTIYDLNAIFIYNSSQKYIVGDGGLLLKKTTGEWKQKTFPAIENLIEVYFENATNGYVVSETGKIWKTTDGGENWNQQAYSSLSDLLGSKLKDIELLSHLGDMYGIAISTTGLIYRSNDIENNWSSSNKISSQLIHSIDFEGSSIYASGFPSRLYRQVGGELRDVPSNETGEWRHLKVKDAHHLLAIVEDASTNLQVKYSENGGLDWNLSNFPAGQIPNTPSQFAFESTNIGYLLNGNATLYKTTDAGKNWTTLPSSSFSPAARIQLSGNVPFVYDNFSNAYAYFSNGSWTTASAIWTTGALRELFLNNLGGVSNSESGIALLDFGGVITKSSGNSWQLQNHNNLNIGEKIAHVYMVDATNGYLLSDAGRLFSTDDGGQVIDLITNLNFLIPSNAVIQSISFNEVSSTATGFINITTTNGSILLKSTDGGVNWTDIADNSVPQALNRLDYIDFSEGIYLAGDNGTLLYSGNNGTSWNYKKSNTKSNLISLDFLDQSEGAIATADNVLISFLGGVQFSTTNSSSRINDIAYANSSNIQFVTEAPSVWSYNTSNSILTNQTTPGATEAFNTIETDGSGNFYLAGDVGGIYSLASGVSSPWVNENNLIPLPLNSVYHLSAQKVYAAGDGNTLLESSDGGKTWKNFLNGFNSPTGIVIDLFDLIFIDQNHALVAGSNGTAYDYDEARPTKWIELNTTQVSNAINLTYFDIESTDANILFILGNDQSSLNKIYYSTGGINGTFQSLSLPAGIGLINDLHMVNSSIGYAVADQGKVIKVEKNNGSGNYAATLLSSSLCSPSTCSFDASAVYFIDQQSGFVVTSNGKLYKTSDGGGTWSDRGDVSNGTQNQINDLTFTSEGKGFYTGNQSVNGLVVDNSNRFSSRSYYDRLGRLIASQNAKQFIEQGTKNRYSYTLYDELGRIKENGELDASTAIESNYNGKQLDQVAFEIWLDGGQKREISRSYYSEQLNCVNGILSQDYLRNRVSAVTYEEVEDMAKDDCIYDHATHYSYDPHGNVKTLIQDFPDLAPLNQQFKKIEYRYDLISNNVLQVNYQAGETDQFYHRYEYDATNRLQNVYTSTDQIHWDQDASYDYYRHGPLKRKALGELEVQGVDFAYTLQGWLKGANANTLVRNRDMGQDALPGSANPYVAADAFGFSLRYHTNDYEDIGLTASIDRFEANASSSLVETNSLNLYNGNISAMVTALEHEDFDNQVDGSMAMLYGYDQLNRIKSATSYTSSTVKSTNDWSGATSNGYLSTSDYIYDANGNLMELNRNDQNGQIMDDFRYRYQNDLDYNYPNGPGLNDNRFTKKFTNRLLAVEDQIATPSIATDIEKSTQAFDLNDAPANNYVYDALGNLKEDKSENIALIEWNMGGKIKQISRGSGEDPDHEFAYNAMGQRVKKIVKHRSSTSPSKEEAWKTLYYVRDANGNILSTYELGNKLLSSSEVRSTLKQKEMTVFGSDRLGLYERNEEMSSVDFLIDGYHPDLSFNVEEYFSPTLQPLSAIEDNSNTFRGAKCYELKNHLDNVLAVISDHKKPLYLNSNEINIIWTEDFPNQDWYTKGDVEFEFGENLTATFASERQTIRRPINAPPGEGCTFQYCFTLNNDYQQGSLWFETYDAKGRAIQSILVTNSSACIPIDPSQEHEIGFRLEDLNNGERLIVLNGRLEKICTSTSFSHYLPIIKQIQDYYPFGATTIGRSTTQAYRYGFNGMERDDEVSGSGNSYTTHFRQFDSRLGRWMSTDPKAVPYEGVYNAHRNNPIKYNDPKGDCPPGTDCGGKATLNYTFGTKGQSRLNFAAGFGVSKTNGGFMSGANLSLNLYSGGPGTSQASTGKSSFGGALTLGLSATFGSGSGVSTDLNMFNSTTISGISNTFKNSGTIGTNLTYNNATGFNRAAGFAGKLGGFTATINEDFTMLPWGFGPIASGLDEGETGGGFLGYTFNNGTSIYAGTEIFTGKPTSYPKPSSINFPGFVEQTTQQQQLNVGRSFLRVENAPSIGNFRIDYSGQSQMWSQNLIHDIMGIDRFRSTATNSLQITP